MDKAAYSQTIPAEFQGRQTGPMQCKPTPQVHAQADRVEKGLSHVHELISELTDRLSGVLNPVPPNGQGCGASPPRPAVSPMAQRLELIGDRTDELVGRLGELISRLDV